MSCIHIVVCDGDEFPAIPIPDNLQIIRLPQPHGMGNTARAIGAASAVAQDCDGIALLDSDNWFDSQHLEFLVLLHLHTGAGFCSSSRRLVTPAGEILGTCPEVDGDRFVDPNCQLYTRRAFPLFGYWSLLPSNLNRKGSGDRWVWEYIRRSKVTRAHHQYTTINYRTRYSNHYCFFGKPIPADSKVAAKITVQDINQFPYDFSV